MTKDYHGTKEYAFIYTELITAAKYRGTITYQEIAKIVGLPMSGSHMGSEIGKILGQISEDEVGNGRPMLSAIAVNVQGVPGPGFYELAKQLGRLKENSDVDIFWQAEYQAVYETWKVVLK
jgi:hypothetical protein